MDDTTIKVRNLYSEYPFPDAEYRIGYGLQLLRYFAQHAPTGKRSVLEGAAVLEAGCGTGNTITHLAKQFPTSKFMGVDLTPASLAVARRRSGELELSNLVLKEDNILTMQLGQRFDVVLNIGVLHHLSDMKAGLRNLVAHLADDGVLVLWLYGTYGRFRLNLNQRMFDLLFSKVPELKQKVTLAKQALSTFPRDLTQCHFNVPFDEIEDDFDASLQYAFKNEAWLVDQFLHINEKTVAMDDILSLLDTVGLKLDRWLGVKPNLSDYTTNADLIKLFDGLLPRDQLLCLDLLLKPNYYLVTARR
ncbi:MAG: class I SAM-dependent methyltransferase [Fimbriimonadaceae bacterium]|nr:class I SAM-dependent methyltransferase [Alphaproteobacteria bacterium]